MQNVKIVIASHKQCRLPNEDMYVPVQVSVANNVPISGYVPDNTGDNISNLNPIFSELTALYWAWKNLDYDWLGLVHYRRFFVLSKNSRNPFNSILTRNQIEPMLSKYRVIVPQKRHYYIETVYSHYSHTFEGTQLDIAMDILREKYPQYVEFFEKVLESRSAYIFNMMIMPRQLVDDYCTWLFDILFELDRRIDCTGMTDFEKRYAGRIGERLFNVWLEYQVGNGKIMKSVIKELPYVCIGEIDYKRKIIGFLEAKFFGRKYEESF